MSRMDGKKTQNTHAIIAMQDEPKYYNLVSFATAMCWFVAVYYIFVLILYFMLFVLLSAMIS